MDFDELEDLILTVESNDEETEFTLTVKSPTGKKIDSHDFILEVEQWLHTLAQAEISRGDPNVNLH